jgi:sodium/bile acid cotransporter 7
MVSRLRDQGFILALAAALLLAVVHPAWGASGGLLRSQHTVPLGIALIFFLQGLTLATEQLWHGLRAWRLHLFIQSWTWLGFPLLALAIAAAAGSLLLPDSIAGLLLLAVLPTTIASAAALTAQAGGHVPLALFNTVLSNLLGIVLTPLWCVALFASGGGDGNAFAGLVGRIFLLIGLPLLLGHLVRHASRARADRYKPVFRRLTSTAIVFIVFAAISDSVASGTWSRAGWRLAAEGATAALVLLLLASTLVWLTAGRVAGDRPQRLAAFFCGSQKTLAAGVPMAAIIFAGSATDLGRLLLPLLAYHPMQLLLGALLAGRWGEGV